MDQGRLCTATGSRDPGDYVDHIKPKDNCAGVNLVPRDTILIIPAHNEEANLGSVLDEVRAVGYKGDIVVINDFSTDRTALVARRKGAEVVNLPCNLGYGGAVQAGFKYAVERGYRFAAVMDADGQHAPESLAALLQPVVEGRADIAVGSRYLGRAEYRVGLARTMGMRFFSNLVSWITGQRITDPTSGYQAMNAEVMRFFSQDNYPADYPDADTIILVKLAGFRLIEVPVVMRGRLSGVSMHSGLKPLYYVVKMMLSIMIVLLRQRSRMRAVRPGPDIEGGF